MLVIGVIKLLYVSYGKSILKDFANIDFTKLPEVDLSSIEDKKHEVYLNTNVLDEKKLTKKNNSNLKHRK